MHPQPLREAWRDNSLYTKDLSFSVGAKHFADFVLIEFLHKITGGTAIFAGIKLTRLVIEHFADCGRKGKTAVGIDVYLANCTLGGLAELCLGDTDCIGQFTAVLINNLDILLRNGRRAVKYDRESGKLILDFLEHVERKWRRNEKPCLGVAFALLRFEFVCTV